MSYQQQLDELEQQAQLHRAMQQQPSEPEQPANPTFLHQLYMSSISKQLQLHMINSYQKEMTTRTVEHIVTTESQRLKTQYDNDEALFVEQMLRDNPVMVERRLSPNSNTSISTGSSTSSSADDTHTPLGGLDPLQHQRSESCRRSRINNKIRQSKMRYRLQYMTAKLKQTRRTLYNMRDFMAQTEQQLLRSGYNAEALLELRQVFGLDNLPHMATTPPGAAIPTSPETPPPPESPSSSSLISPASLSSSMSCHTPTSLLSPVSSPPSPMQLLMPLTPPTPPTPPHAKKFHF